ncbi:MAG: ImmA/IrrE family metallo-endopeptidase [Dehalococcoidia bacterium]
MIAEQHARQVRDRHRVSIPADTWRVADECEAVVVAERFPARLCAEAAFLDYPLIVLNCGLGRAERRYVLAHELFHYLCEPRSYRAALHRGDVRRWQSEARARAFADQLVMPDQEMEIAVREGWSAEQMLLEFGVTEERLARRWARFVEQGGRAVGLPMLGRAERLAECLAAA